MEKEVNIIIVDDQKLFREGTASLLKYWNINVIAEAKDGEELLILLKTLIPDAVLLDIDMKGLDGSQTLDRVRKEFPNVKIIIVTMYDDESLIKDFFNRGACAFLTKDSSGEIIDEAIRSVIATGEYKGNLAEMESQRKRVAKRIYYKSLYTRRELEIIALLCKTKSNTEMALALSISVKAIETNLTEIYKKSRVESRAEFIKYVFTKGLNYLGVFPVSEI